MQHLDSNALPSSGFDLRLMYCVPLVGMIVLMARHEACSEACLLKTT